MSIQLMDAIWKKSKHKGAALLMLLAMADYANDDGTGIWPSYETLARKSRLSRRQAINIVKALIDSGVVSRAGKSAGGSNSYTINTGMIGSEKISPAASEAHFTSTGEAHFTRLVKPASPNPSINHQITVSGDACASPRAPESPVQNTTQPPNPGKVDEVMLAHASKDRTEKAILRARCSEPARALMRAFYNLTRIAYTKDWPSAAETMAGAGVTEADLRAAWDESKRGKAWAVNDPHSLSKTAIRIASQRRATFLQPGEKLEYDAATGAYIKRSAK